MSRVRVLSKDLRNTMLVRCVVIERYVWKTRVSEVPEVKTMVASTLEVESFESMIMILNTVGYGEVLLSIRRGIGPNLFSGHRLT